MIAKNLQINIFGIVNVISKCTILYFRRLFVQNGELNVNGNSLYLNVSEINIGNNGIIKTNNVNRTINNDNYNQCNQTIYLFNNGNNINGNKAFSVSYFKSCFDLLIRTNNLSIYGGGKMDVSYAEIVTDTLHIRYNASISAVGRGYSNENANKTALFRPNVTQYFGE